MPEEQLDSVRNDLEALVAELEEQLTNDMETKLEMNLEGLQEQQTTEQTELIEVLTEIKELNKANLYINTTIFGVIISSLAIITLLKGIFK